MKVLRNSILIVCGVAVAAMLLTWSTGISFTLQGTLRAKVLGHLRYAAVVSRSNYRWGTVYVFNTPTEYKTVLSEKHGLLWHFVAQWHVKKTTFPIQTIGWASSSQYNHPITVLVIKNTDPNVTQIEEHTQLTPTITKPITLNHPLVLSWHSTNIFGNGMKLYALSKSGKRLYQYGFQTNGNVTREGATWYTVSGH